MRSVSYLLAAMAMAATPATAATLSVSGGTSSTLPSDYDVPEGGAPDDPITIFSGLTFTGGLSLDSPAKLTYEYLGSEAGHSNTSFDTSGVQFNNDTSSVGDTQTVIDGPGKIDFSFATDNGTGTGAVDFINNMPGSADDTDLSLVFGKVSGDGSSVNAYFGDGTGDDDYDDLVVGITASPVPVPAAMPLLLGGLGGLGGLGFAGRRRKRAA